MCRLVPEEIRLFRRIGDKSGEASGEFNLGHAYFISPGIEDLDASEAAFRRCLGLLATTMS